MRKFMIFAALAAVLAISCQKNDNPKPETQGRPMTLIANIGDATKVNYTPDGNVLKTTWEAEETISVVSFSVDDHEVASIDNFTSTGEAGRTTAKFTGTFTGPEDFAGIIVLYPALQEVEPGIYSTAPYKDYDGHMLSTLDRTHIGYYYFDGGYAEPLRQVADDDASHLRNYCVMSGITDDSDIKNNILTASLENEMTVLKIHLTVPDAYKGKQLQILKIEAFDSEDNTEDFARAATWEYVNIPINHITGAGGSYKDEAYLYSDIIIPESGQVTLYFANHLFAPIKAGTKWNFSIYVDDAYSAPGTRVFTSDFTLERGNIYRVSATIPE